MMWYARPSWRLVGQLVGDVGVVIWAITWWLLSRGVVAAIRQVASPLRDMAGALTGVSNDVTDTGGRIAGIPLLGSGLAQPFTSAGQRLQGLVASLLAQAGAIDRGASLVGWVLFLLPVGLALLVWVPPRVRFAREAGVARRMLDAGVDLELFAWRAMARRPLGVVQAISDAPVAEVRQGHQEVILALARAELRSAGLDVPPGYGQAFAARRSPGRERSLRP
ncbi:hypothetical protein [Raineyella fluvialis]|uniref:Uncharacterized protein n=1 Tax=Raineyella fluvialis TaxID=2662261 RepID=A0A5Q2FGH2_9ACTN|nr:hypothetical protein [Raineyella fluvialis]QGF24897.1 hypothetical protein Rai3103_16155 [Raineyella fluvialis]